MPLKRNCLFKAKNSMMLIGFILEKLLYEEGEDSSYNTKIKMQKNIRVLKKG